MEVRVLNRTAGRAPGPALGRLVRRAAGRLPDAAQASGRLREITIVCITPAESRRLKRTFLQQDRPADVLSFRYGREGEILLAPAVIRRDARRTGRAYRRMLPELALHGLLHLLGYHHEGSRSLARRFEARERSLLESFGLV
ncbi:MAG: rRNA maturation RNase YbeY [bacterium]|nr:rRNA maturation RNase YbeY [bacterium]